MEEGPLTVTHPYWDRTWFSDRPWDPFLVSRWELLVYSAWVERRDTWDPEWIATKYWEEELRKHKLDGVGTRPTAAKSKPPQPKRNPNYAPDT